MIDEDLGRSGSGTARAGFEKLLTTICERNVGAVLSLEASRLARNGRDWHTLLEFCGLVGTLIVDEDGIYDPKNGSRSASEWPTGSKQKRLQTLRISPFWSDAEQCKVPLKQPVAAPLHF